MTSSEDEVIYLMMDILLLGALWFFVWGGICAWLAREKGRDAFAWFFAGGLFGFVALALLGFAPKIEPYHYVRASADRRPLRAGIDIPFAGSPVDVDKPGPQVAGATRICPDCAEEVKSVARICRFCRYDFVLATSKESA